MTDHTQQLLEILEEIISCGRVDADPVLKRISWINVQIDRRTLEEAEALVRQIKEERDGIL